MSDKLISFNHYTKKITKIKFEKLMTEAVKGDITSRVHIEKSICNFERYQQKMHLYYSDEKHFATWSQGSGWLVDLKIAAGY